MVLSTVDTAKDTISVSWESAVEDAKKLWSELYGKELSEEEINEIEANMVTFIKILLRQQRRNENGKK